MQDKKDLYLIKEDDVISKINAWNKKADRFYPMIIDENSETIFGKFQASDMDETMQPSSRFSWLKILFLVSKKFRPEIIAEIINYLPLNKRSWLPLISLSKQLTTISPEVDRMLWQPWCKAYFPNSIIKEKDLDNKYIPNIYQMSFSTKIAELSVKVQKECSVSLFDIFDVYEVDKNLLLNDKFFILEILNNQHHILQHLSDNLKNTIDIALEAVKRNSFALRFIPENLKNNFPLYRKIVLEAVKKNGSALQFVSQDERFIKDFEIVLEAVKTNGIVLQYASKSLQNNKEVVLTAVRQSGMALEYASLELQSNKEIILEALNDTSAVWALLEKENFKPDQEILLAIAKSCDFLNNFYPDASDEDIEVIYKKIIHTEDLLLEVIKNSEMEYDFIPEDFMSNPQFLLKAVKANSLMLRFANKEAQDDYHTVLEAVKQNGLALMYASERLKQDLSINESAVRNNYEALEYVTNDFKDSIIYKEIILKAIKEHYYVLDFIAEELKKDKEFILTAATINIWETFSIAHDELKNNKEFILEFLNTTKDDLGNHCIFKMINDNLKTDKDFILKALKINGLIIKFLIDDFKQDEEIVRTSANQNPLALLYAHSKFRTDPEFIKEYTFRLDPQSVYEKFTNKTEENIKNSKTKNITFFKGYQKEINENLQSENPRKKLKIFN